MQRLTTRQVEQIRRQDAETPMINVLPAEAYRREHIPGTVNIPLASADFEFRVEQQVGSREEPVIVYCASEQCDASPRAAQRLEGAGFTHVFDYEGGTEAWKQAGHDVASGV